MRKTTTPLLVLHEMTRSVDLPNLKVYEKWFEDKRNKNKYFLQLGQETLSPMLNYERMSHFILGFSEAKRIFTNKILR